MIPRTVFSEEHEIFRHTVRNFVETEIVPHHRAWEDAGIVDRSCWQKAGAAGLLCCGMPEDYGGAGGDFLFGAIVQEELAFAGTTGPGFHLHSDIVAPYILHYGTEAQKQTYLPRMARGEIIGALAMSEPNAGSDVSAISTKAEKTDGGYLLNGQKIFITNGQCADIVVVACKTKKDAGAKGISLLIVERDDKGFERGRNLEKIGWHAQDTSELFFDDVFLPNDRLLGPLNGGFACLMDQLPQERLLACVRGTAAIEAVVDLTAQYVQDRQVFGKPLSAKQNTRFTMADAKTHAITARVLTDKLIELHQQGGLDATQAAVGKLYVTELCTTLMDDCLQLHGGYGYMREYAVARAWVDNRFSRIAGGSSEIMRELIARFLFGR
ncbi:MAG: acyl-CoA dehydrogenase family protein [Pseudomonadota bacterium]